MSAASRLRITWAVLAVLAAKPAILPVGAQPTGKIVFASHRARQQDLYIMAPVYGSRAARLTRTPENEAEPALSPDGSRVAFTVYPPGDLFNGDTSRAEIYVMDADGSNRRRLTRNKVEDSSPAWSPDGKWIAFESDRGDNSDIYIINADGSGLRRVTSHPSRDSTPSWSPDGSRLAFASARGKPIRGVSMWRRRSTPSRPRAAG
jgi:TolB protein